MSWNPRDLGLTGASLIFLYGLPHDLPQHVREKLNGMHPNAKRPMIAFVKDLVAFAWLPVVVQGVFIYYLFTLVWRACGEGAHRAGWDSPVLLIGTAILVHFFHRFNELPLGVRALMFIHEAEWGVHEMDDGTVYEGGASPLHSGDESGETAASGEDGDPVDPVRSIPLRGGYFHQKTATFQTLKRAENQFDLIDITSTGRPHPWYVPVVASFFVIFDKFIVPSLIVVIGGLFLCTSNNAGELVLNSAAVVCVNEVDEMIMSGGQFTSNLVWQVNLPILSASFRKWWAVLVRETAIIPICVSATVTYFGHVVLEL